MSRIARQNIKIPTEVTCLVMDDHILCKGALGENIVHMPQGFVLEINNGMCKVNRVNDKVDVAKWGSLVSNLKNAILGVTKKFEQNITFSGVGYKAIKHGSILEVHLGYSHAIMFDIPNDVQIDLKKPNEMVLSSHNKQLLGETSARLEKLRKPEPYKGKGVIREGKFYIRKEGKSK
jgi:large subunit ribosomal protein L6